MSIQKILLSNPWGNSKKESENPYKNIMSSSGENPTDFTDFNFSFQLKKKKEK